MCVCYGGCGGGLCLTAMPRIQPGPGSETVPCNSDRQYDKPDDEPLTRSSDELRGGVTGDLEKRRGLWCQEKVSGTSNCSSGLLRNAGELQADNWLNHVSLTFGKATKVHARYATGCGSAAGASASPNNLDELISTRSRGSLLTTLSCTLQCAAQHSTARQQHLRDLAINRSPFGLKLLSSITHCAFLVNEMA